ncbi:hypothetical protein CNR22_22955 [Sphingobacteriaceae bacterium]|nr:hypothetical protein CNR22_22955 [Sphingobacteriaceae bacterium]
MPIESENIYNLLGLKVADHVSAMLAYWDKDLICRFANAAYRDWFGKTKEEMVNKMTIKELLGPLFDINEPYISGALEGRSQTFEREIRLPTGELRYSLANYFPDSMDGKVRGFFVHVADVSSIKRLEMQLVKSNEIITEQNKRLMNFANVTSHNLGNYSHGFAGYLEMLEENVASESQVKIINKLKTISTNFTETVKNLNEVVYMQNTGTVELIEINLYDYIIKTIATLHVQIRHSQVLIFNAVSADTVILCNPAYLESILMNLLTNAITYRQPERVATIELKCSAEKEEVVFSITDNGRGMNLEKHGSDLFGMYKTFHDNPNARGLGLYITRYQIETMGGRIKVESEEGRGTKFTVYLKQK